MDLGADRRPEGHSRQQSAQDRPATGAASHTRSLRSSEVGPISGCSGSDRTSGWGDQSLVNFSLAGTSIWRYVGLNFVLFLGAIQSIPANLYEAAEIDGASRWQQFRYIILPGIRPILSLSAFEITFIMTGGATAVGPS